VDGFAAVDGFFDPPSCKEVALFSFFFEGVDGLAADFLALPLSSRLFDSVCCSDVLSPCEDSEVGRVCSEVDDSYFG